ncbi:olfactory receptor 5AP2-like [Pelodiscus sinensis]|uniref:olfactory receptor 5AP2-like n=1 Tax=Pelodiscus sinensis TaxID=13735 RepID=UPI003F6B7FBF
MILLIAIDHQLHTPMYIFLSILSACDLCYSSTIAPNMLQNFFAERKSISYSGCYVQMYLFICLADIECLLLAVMAYDCYVAICNLLLYMVTMSTQRCSQLVAGVCTVGLVDAMIHTCLTFRLSFCRSNVIDRLFCDIPPLLALSCSDTHINETVMIAFVDSIVVSSTVSVLLSYVCIIYTILQIRSAEGRHKTFSTCACHLTAVVMFYGSQLFVCFHHTFNSTEEDKIASMFYTVVLPMLNPLIYTLRNREVKDALRKAVKECLIKS